MGDTNCDYLNQSNNDTKHMKKIAHKLGFSHIIKEATRTFFFFLRMWRKK